MLPPSGLRDQRRLRPSLLRGLWLLVGVKAIELAVDRHSRLDLAQERDKMLQRWVRIHNGAISGAMVEGMTRSVQVEPDATQDGIMQDGIRPLFRWGELVEGVAATLVLGHKSRLLSRM